MDELYKGIQAERVVALNEREPAGGRYVGYWMQQSQRAEFNPALEYAVHRANELKLPLVVSFGLMEDYPEANLRHYLFMLQGLADVEATLGKRNITFVVRRGAPDDVALELARDAALLVCDRGYLRHQRAWRRTVAEKAACPVIQVEGDVVVPVELVSDKQESAARTIRPKISRHLDRFLVPLATTTLHDTSRPSIEDGEDLSDVDGLARRLKIDTEVAPVPLFTGGTSAGQQTLRAFLRDHFTAYAEHRNQPQTDDVSHMSKYLHYGQLSPVWIALQVRGEIEKQRGGTNVDDYLEELIVRRELPMNYVFYAEQYDAYAGLPNWAKTTLEEHAKDERNYTYTRAQLERAQTHDEYWNASMRELVHTGYMHNHMRMYWGKKILEWSSSPQTAYRTTLYLNNRYFLDGRDANSFANVAWIFGQHDRGWTEREVFGKVRYMNAEGLRRKADPDAYVAKVDALVAKVDALRAGHGGREGNK